MQPDLQVLMSEIRRIGQEELMPRFRQVNFSIKQDGSLVTEADLAANQRIQNFLQKQWPQIDFLSEEMDSAAQNTLLANSKSLWCLDPLDGTTNFTAGVPLFGVSLALIQAGEVVLALSYDPFRDEMFSAIKGQGAWLNGQRLFNKPSVLAFKQSVALVDFKRLPKSLGKQLVEHCPYGSQRNLGTCALEWAWLAAGRGQLYLHGGMKIWDLAAGVLLLKEAGGVSCTLEGQEVFVPRMETRSVMAALDPALFQQWQSYLQGSQ